MAITVNLYYTGKGRSARKFAEEMESSGTAAAIRAEAGNLRYEYFLPMNDPETVFTDRQLGGSGSDRFASCFTDDGKDIGTSGEI
ncbi:hypothetical protein [Bilifractor sp. HCP3S3_D3]|uniref:hypothetical protein n=1 Tax=Bilifractor sp. HCP3S3_D3 TaxID=3438907 RepID=UPI003F8A7712